MGRLLTMVTNKTSNSGNSQHSGACQEHFISVGADSVNVSKLNFINNKNKSFASHSV